MEVINLNLIPGKAWPVAHATQFDKGREFRANLFEGSQVYTLAGDETVDAIIKKPDGNQVTETLVNTADNYVIVTTTEQMTAVAGPSLGEIRLSKGDTVIGSLKFILECEQSADTGIESHSEINNLETQVDGMVSDALATQYDSENVVFDNLPTEGHGVPYTVTSEGIGEAIDNALDMTDTASGAIATFDTSLALPLQDCTIEINAVQEAGTPTPTDPKAITGFTGANVTRCGVNLLPLKFYKGLEYNSVIGNTFDTEEATDGTVSGNTVSFNIGSWSRKCMLSQKLSSGVEYRLTMTVTTTASNLNYTEFYLDKNLKVTRKYNIQNGGKSRTVNAGFTLNDNECYIAIELGCSNSATIVFDSPMLNVGSTATAYHAYNGLIKNIAFTDGDNPLTVYGGSLDVTSGVLTVTHGYIASYNGEAINEPWISSKDEYSAGATPTTGAQIVYPLTTPTTVQLTPTQISAIVGTNNVFTDTNGDTTLEYYTKRGEQTVRIAEGVAVDVINNENIDNLTTTDKTLVGAVNEVNGKTTVIDVIPNITMLNNYTLANSRLIKVGQLLVGILEISRSTAFVNNEAMATLPYYDSIFNIIIPSFCSTTDRWNAITPCNVFINNSNGNLIYAGANANVKFVRVPFAIALP